MSKDCTFYRFEFRFTNEYGFESRTICDILTPKSELDACEALVEDMARTFGVHVHSPKLLTKLSYDLHMSCYKLARQAKERVVTYS